MAPLFKELEFFKQRNIQGNDIIQVCSEMKYECIRAGDAVFKFGEHGDKFYVILRGEVCVKVPDAKYKKSHRSHRRIQQKASIKTDVSQIEDRKRSILSNFTSFGKRP